MSWLANLPVAQKMMSSVTLLVFCVILIYGGTALAMRDLPGMEANRFFPLFICSTLLAFSIMLIWFVLLYQSVTVPLQKATSMAQQLAKGDLAIELFDATRRDELGQLQRALMEIARSSKEISLAADRLAEGDLSAKITPRSSADVLCLSLSNMVESMAVTTRQVREAISIVSGSVSDIMSSIAQSASGANQTAAAVTETTTTVEQVRQTSQLASQKAQHVLVAAEKTTQITSAGRLATEETIAGMRRIREQMNLIAESMIKLSDKSQSMVEIIETVHDLSQQSNILAVNAAIEATRAGEFGKGFIVVAEEVKSLADQSKQATAQVRSILTDIQQAISSVAMATELGSKAVDSAVVQSLQAGESINALGQSVHESAQAATQIAVSSKEQLIGVDQIATAMIGINDATQENQKSVDNVETAAINLRNLGSHLTSLMQRYRV